MRFIELKDLSGQPLTLNTDDILQYTEAKTSPNYCEIVMKKGAVYFVIETKEEIDQLISLPSIHV